MTSKKIIRLMNRATGIRFMQLASLLLGSVSEYFDDDIQKDLNKMRKKLDKLATRCADAIRDELEE